MRCDAGFDGGEALPENEAVFHYLHDILGSVVALTDSAGRVVERYTYDPYGEPAIEPTDPATGLPLTDVGGGGSGGGSGGGPLRLAASGYGNPFLWTGQRYDAGVRLYHFLYRGYSPRLGRWLQRDPLGQVDGPNFYEYVRSRPSVLVDLVGLCSEYYGDPNKLMWCFFFGCPDLHPDDDKHQAELGEEMNQIIDNRQQIIDVGISTIPIPLVPSLLGEGVNIALDAAQGDNEGAMGRVVDAGLGLAGDAVGKLSKCGGKAVCAVDDVAPKTTGAAPKVSTKGYGNVGGGATTAENALTQAEKYLGPGYKEISPGVYRSADGARQFRMTNSDLLDPRQGPHVHFEAIGPDGRTIVENSHVTITNP